MVYTLYDASVPLAQHSLTSLTNILKKAEAAPNSAGFVSASIHADMLPLSFQIHIITDNVRKLIAKATATEPPTLERNLASFADFYKRIDETQAALAGLSREAVDASADKLVPVALGPGRSGEMPLSGFVNGYYLPNLFFHVTTAYAILRKEGIALGKFDFLGPYIFDHLPAEIKKEFS